MAASKPAKRSATQSALPTAVLTGTELAILTSLVSGGGKSLGDLGVKGVDALVTFLRNEGPIAHRVLASWSEAARFVVALEFVNTTMHGGYVEALAVTKPGANFDFDIALPKRKPGHAGLGVNRPAAGEVPVGEFFWKKQVDALPLYVAPGESSTIVLRLTDDQSKTLSRARTVEFSYEFSMAGGKDAASDQKKSTKSALVRLRKHGPAYLK